MLHINKVTHMNRTSNILGENQYSSNAMNHKNQEQKQKQATQFKREKFYRHHRKKCLNLVTPVNYNHSFFKV